MNELLNIKSGIKKIGVTFGTQVLILGCSLITSLLIPKYMGTETYGYWQIYYFYLNYINFITLGYNDGIVLRYGGLKKNELPIEKIRVGNILVFLLSALISLVGVIIIQCIQIADYQKHIFTVLFLNMPLVCVMNVILSLFLSINKQNVYNLVNLASRLVVTVGYCIVLFAGFNDYISMIRIDYIVRVLIVVVCCIIGGYFLLGKRDCLEEGLKEVKANCGGGIYITFGALCASFAPLAGRVVLEQRAAISEYAIYSFAMSVLALIVTFTNAAGVVFFPMLKTLDSKSMLKYYEKIKRLYNAMIYVALICYVPVVWVIRNYLSEYGSVLEYIYIIMAICIPLGKVQILLTPYMKAFRLEKQYLIANLICSLLVYAGARITYEIFPTAMAIAVITLIIYELWGLVFEFYLQHKCKLTSNMNIKEVTILLFFLLSSMSNNMLFFIICYVMAGMLQFFLWYRNRYLS